MAWDSAANIINDAAVELGLLAADVPEPFDSTDPNIIQMCRLLKSIGQDMVREFPWSHLQRTNVFTTSEGVETYQMPGDFGRLIDQTEWNRTWRMPLLGPLNAQSWQFLKAWNVTGIAYRYFRVQGTNLLLHNVPTASEVLAYEYISLYWVQSLDATEPDKETVTSGEDTLLLDRRLLVTALKLRWKRAKGFDSTAEQEDYERALARAQGGDGGAPILQVGGRRRGPDRLIDVSNLPDTGYGS